VNAWYNILLGIYSQVAVEELRVMVLYTGAQSSG